WSRISFKKKYLHRFLTEARKLPWLKENSRLHSQGRTVEMGTLSWANPFWVCPGPVLGFIGFTSPAGFSTCAGPTSEAIPDPFDDAP
ncbi:unnamed protein product, partial [Prunus brigantina]